MGNSSFSFETLVAYQVARAAVVVLAGHREALRGLPGDINSQLHRAMYSVVLNIAEGTGREHPGDQARCYSIARGSLAEVAAAIDIVTLYGALPPDAVAQLNARLRHTGRLLTGLIRRAATRESSR